MNSATRSILTSSSNLILSRFLGIAVKFFYVIVLARYLGAQNYGLYNYALGLYLLFFPLCSLGLWAVIYRDIGQSEAKGRKTIALTLGLRSVLSVVAAILCLAVGWTMESNSTTQIVILVFSFALLGRALANWVEHVATAFGRSVLVLRLEGTFRPLESGFGILVIFLDGGVIALSLVHAVVWWCQGIYGSRLINRKLGPFKPKYEWIGIKRLLKKGAVLGIGAFLTVWFLQGPLILYRLTEGLSPVLGQISLLMQVFTMLVLIPEMVVAAALPVISTKSMQDEKNDLKFAKLMMKASWAVFCVGGLMALDIAPLLFPFVFGEQYQMAGNFVAYFLFALVPWCWAMAIWQVEVSRGSLLVPTLWLLWGVCVFTGLYLLLVPFMGIAGVVLALMSGAMSWAVGLGWRLSMDLVYLMLEMIAISMLALFAILAIDLRLAAIALATGIIFAGSWFLLYREMLPGREGLN